VQAARHPSPRIINNVRQMKIKYLGIFLSFATAVLANDVKLPSGRVLKNAIVGPMASTKATFSRMLALKYETSADFNSRKAISEEVEDVWKSFRLEAESGKYEAAVVMVIGPPPGFVLVDSTSGQKNFVFEKKDGVWKMLPYPWEKERVPNHVPDPTSASGTPPAGQESRPR
jgi:hypothetical protein